MLVGERRFALFYAWPHMINPQYLDGAKAASQSEPRSQQRQQPATHLQHCPPLHSGKRWALFVSLGARLGLLSVSRAVVTCRRRLRPIVIQLT